MINTDHQITWRSSDIFAFTLLALHLKLLEQKDTRVEGEVVEAKLLWMVPDDVFTELVNRNVCFCCYAVLQPE